MEQQCNCGVDGQGTTCEMCANICQDSARRRLKPGTLKEVASVEERLTNEKQALRMKKSRAVRKLQNLCAKLKKEQTVEPVETLFVIREIKTNRFKYCGDGQLLNNFVLGKPLAPPPPMRKNKYNSLVSEASVEKVVEPLTPQHYTYACGVGSGKTLAEGQKEQLDNVRVATAGSNVAFNFSSIRGGSGARRGLFPTVSTRGGTGRGGRVCERGGRGTVRGRRGGRRGANVGRQEMDTTNEVEDACAHACSSTPSARVDSSLSPSTHVHRTPSPSAHQFNRPLSPSLHGNRSPSPSAHQFNRPLSPSLHGNRSPSPSAHQFNRPLSPSLHGNRCPSPSAHQFNRPLSPSLHGNRCPSPSAHQFNRSLSPSLHGNRSPSPSARFDHSPPPSIHRSPSPSTHVHRSTSPSPHVHRSPSPSPHVHRSPSPSPSAHVHRSTSPSAHVHHSPSPSAHVHCSTSPSPHVHRSPSPSPSAFVHRSTSPSPHVHHRPSADVGCPKSPSHNVKAPQCGNFIEVEFTTLRGRKEKYVGEVLDIIERDVYVDFLANTSRAEEKKRNVREDKSWVHIDDVVKIFDFPETVFRGRTMVLKFN